MANVQDVEHAQGGGAAAGVQVEVNPVADAQEIQVSPPPNVDDLRQRITRLYEKYNPAKIADLPALFQKYNGMEQRLLDSIIDKYVDQLTEAQKAGLFKFVR